MFKVSEDYIVGFDLSNTDDATITVARRVGTKLEYINTLNGEEAKIMYEKLTNVSLERGNNKNEQVQSN